MGQQVANRDFAIGFVAVLQPYRSEGGDVLAGRIRDPSACLRPAESSPLSPQPVSSSRRWKTDFPSSSAGRIRYLRDPQPPSEPPCRPGRLTSPRRQSVPHPHASASLPRSRIGDPPRSRWQFEHSTTRSAATVSNTSQPANISWSDLSKDLLGENAIGPHCKRKRAARPSPAVSTADRVDTLASPRGEGWGEGTRLREMSRQNASRLHRKWHWCSV